MTRTALVSGANGFVGSHLVDHLRTGGWGVRALVRRTSNTRWLPKDGIELVYGDATDPRSLPPIMKGVDVVFHVAGITRAEDEATYLRVNSEGSGNLTRAAASAAVERFVLVSSLAAGGPSTVPRARREEDEDRPISAYGRSKRGGEEELIRNAGELDWTILRPPAVYGPRDDGFHVLATMVARGWKFRITGPVQPVSVIHVRDLVRALADASQSDTTRGKKYYVANREPTALREMANLMADGLGRRARDLMIPRFVLPGLSRGAGLLAAVMRRENPFPLDRIRDLLVEAWTCDSSRAHGDFGFTPSVNLVQGLRETMQWYEKEGWI